MCNFRAERCTYAPADSICSGPIVSTFNVIRFDVSLFSQMPVRKRKQKGLRVSNFAFSLAIFKRHHGSEGVNNNSNLATVSVTLFRHASPTFKGIGKRQPAVTYDIAAAGVHRHDLKNKIKNSNTYYDWLLLYSTVLCSREDPLRFTKCSCMLGY